MSLPPSRRPKQKPIRKIEASGDIILAYLPQFTRKFESVQRATLEKPDTSDKGSEYLNNKEYQKALEYYEKVIKNPNDSKKWVNKSIAYANLGRLDELFDAVMYLWKWMH